MEAPEKTEGRRKKKAAEETGIRELLEHQSRMLGEILATTRSLARRVRRLEEEVGILSYVLDSEYRESDAAEEAESSEDEPEGDPEDLMNLD
jgi:hypothetical protein